MKKTLMTFSLMREGMAKSVDADLLCRIIRESGYEEADIMEHEFRIYGREKLLKAIEKYQVRVGCIITSAPFFTAPEQVEAGIAGALELAQTVKAPFLMVVPGGADPADIAACSRMSREEILGLTVEHFRKICEMAKEKGITVILENTPHAHKPLACAQDIRQVLDQVPELGLVFDTGNFRVADVNADELAAYELLKDRIVRFHLKEVRIGNFPMGERCVNGQAIRAVLTGSGVIPLQELIRRSIADGFEGTYAVEYAATAGCRGAAHIEAAAAYRKIIETMETGEGLVRCPKKKIEGIDKPVSEIFFGTAIMPVMMGGPAEYLMDAAMAYGINAFDCARGYGNAEKTLGDWMKARDNREEVVVLTKCGNAGPGGSVCVNRHVIETELEESLRQLQTDYIDIYLLHRDDPKTPVEEIIDTLNEAKKAGRIRIFGVSNWTVRRIQEANAYAAANGLEGFSVSSPNYSLTRQVTDPWGGDCVTISGPENRQEREWYRETGMPVIAYSSLGRGFLSGRFASFDWEGARRVLDPFAQKGFLSEDNMLRLQKAEELAKESGFTVPQIAVQFVLSSPMNTFAAASMSGLDRIAENAAAAAGKMPRETWEMLDAI